MNPFQLLLFKITVGLLATVCTIILTLEFIHPTTHVSLSRTWGMNFGTECGSKAVVETIFTEKTSSGPPQHFLPSENSRSDWESATARPDWGGLWVQRNETYRQGWGISMFHALHCLEMIRGSVEEKAGHQMTHGEHGHHDHHVADHVHHCFVYISQTIICAGDGTIEPAWEETDISGNIMKDGVDGEGYQHQCRDTRRLWEVSLQSEERPIEPWDWRMGDTVESLRL